MGEVSIESADDGFPAAAAHRNRVVESRDGPARRAEAHSAKAYDLARLIESQIIPRLMLAHDSADRAEAAKETPPAAVLPSVLARSGVAQFARIVVEKDVDAAFGYVESMRRAGVSLEIVFLDLLSPAARLLGEMWEKDTAYFSDVAVGLSRLHHLVRELSPEFQSEGKKDELGGQALFLPMPGEQHTLGLVLVVEFFRRAGWDVWGWPLPMGRDLLTTIRDENFDLVGLSVSCDASVEPLTALIAAVRKASRNRAVRVIVGGPLFLRRPELVAQVGADATAIDGRQSVELARKLVGKRL